MNKSELSRKFIEAMLRLKRDTIKQGELKIQPLEGLNFKIGQTNETEIQYVSKNGTWSVNSPKLKDNNWNPTLVEIIDFLLNYTEKEIIDSIENLYTIINSVYSKISAVSLFTKVKSILHLLEFEENQVEKNGLSIETEIGKYYIYYDNDLKSLLFTNINREGSIHLTDKELMLLLENTTYLNVMDELNSFYLNLKRKK